MIVFVSDYSYDNPEVERSDVEQRVRAVFGALFPDVGLSRSDIGRGADWPTIVVALGGIFFLGKRISENVEAWCSLAGKFGQAIRQLSAQGAAFRVDEEACQLLALEKITSRFTTPPQSVEYIGVQTHVLDTFEGRDPNTLEGSPERLYVFSYRVDGQVAILGMKSSGTFEFAHYFDVGWTNFEKTQA
jgi:hypothetical protein